MRFALSLWFAVAVRAWAVTALIIGTLVAVTLAVSPNPNGIVWWQAAILGAFVYGLWFAWWIGLAAVSIALAGMSRWWVIVLGATAGMVTSWGGVGVGAIVGALVAWRPEMRGGMTFVRPGSGATTSDPL